MQDERLTVTAESVAAAIAAALTELRDVATVSAERRGHVLGRWHELIDDCEVAYCRGCWRAAVINVHHDPHVAGPAVSEACGPRRPDAFLVNQHESDTHGGRR